MQIRSCRSIGDRSLQQEPTKYERLRAVSATRYDFPYHEARRGISRTYNKQCWSCTQWRRNAKNRSARSGIHVSIAFTKPDQNPPVEDDHETSIVTRYATIKSQGVSIALVKRNTGAGFLSLERNYERYMYLNTNGASSTSADLWQSKVGQSDRARIRSNVK